MKKQSSELAAFLFEMGTLRKIMRSHRQTLLTDDMSDNIASHSYRVIIIGWFLAKLEKVDAYKVMVMGMIHDMGESRSGDQNWINKRYLKVYGDEIRESQFNNLPANQELKIISDEYEARETKEAKVAKDADLLDQILLLKEYVLQGNSEAAYWLGGVSGATKNEQVKRLQTKSGKKLAKEIIKQSPHDWWRNLWTGDRR